MYDLSNTFFGIQGKWQSGKFALKILQTYIFNFINDLKFRTFPVFIFTIKKCISKMILIFAELTVTISLIVCLVNYEELTVVYH